MFTPIPDAILSEAGKLVTDDMLEEISQGDWGIGAEEALNQLLVLRDEVCIPDPISIVQEVLELGRSSRPRGERAHIMRAFCCAALLSAEVAPANAGRHAFLGKMLTIGRLIESALALGCGLPKATGDFCAWRFGTLAENNLLSPLYAFAMVALALLDSGENFTSNEADALADFIEQTEASVRDPSGVSTEEMFPTSFLTDAAAAYQGRVEEWRPLAMRLRLKFPHAPRLVALMERIKVK